MQFKLETEWTSQWRKCVEIELTHGWSNDDSVSICKWTESEGASSSFYVSEKKQQQQEEEEV